MDMHSENIEKIDLSAICRICLKSETFMNNLFVSGASEILSLCFFLEVDINDGLPQQICISCNNTLVESYKLKQLCISSKLYLQSILESQDKLQLDNMDQILRSECDKRDEFLEQSPDGSILKDSQLVSDCLGYDEGEDAPGDSKLNRPDSLLLVDDCDRDCDNAHFQRSSPAEIISNPNKIKYECSQCNITFEHQQDVFVHQSIHRTDGLFCNVCKKVFKTMKVLKRHLKTHMIVKSHVCKMCNKGFPESSDVVKHAKRHHFGIPREKKYQCPECGQRFTDQYYLKVHQRKHTGEKPLGCELCHKSFYDPRSLKVHINAHKGIKPHLCSFCGKSFLQNSHFKQHMLVHSKERPHPCKTCGKRFSQSTSLQRHQKVHQILHKCPLCSEGFSTKSLLMRHEMEDHNIKRKRGRKKIFEEDVMKS